jgi:hypothetical protein
VGHNFLEFIHPDDAGSSQGSLNAAVAGNDLTNFENRHLDKHGSLRWISWHTSVENGLVYGYGRDVTAEKNAAAELARAQNALRQSQKMEAMGQLTGGIAHDFNNMLAIVIGSLDIAGRRLRRGKADVEEYLENARAGATRAATLTERLLAFSRQSPLSPRVLNLNEMVASMSELLRRTLGERIGLETVLAGGLWVAHVDSSQLESAVLNLAVNARDAMPDGGKLTIETANVYLRRSIHNERGRTQAWSIRDDCRDRRGRRHTARHSAKGFRSVFHYQARRQGNGAGSLNGLWLCQAVGRPFSLQLRPRRSCSWRSWR